MLLETLMSDPDSVQKALPHPPEGFLVFFGAGRRRVGGLGRASPWSSSRSGTLVGKATRGEPAEPNYIRAAAPAADPGRMVMWLYDSYIIYQMMV